MASTSSTLILLGSMTQRDNESQGRVLQYITLTNTKINPEYLTRLRQRTTPTQTCGTDSIPEKTQRDCEKKAITSQCSSQGRSTVSLDRSSALFTTRLSFSSARCFWTSKSKLGPGGDTEGCWSIRRASCSSRDCSPT